MTWFIQRPTFGESSSDGFVIKNWLVAAYRWMRGEAFVSANQVASFTADASFFFPCDATSGNITVTLPLSSNFAHKKYIFKKIDASGNTVTISRSGSDTIDGATTKVLAARYDKVGIIADGQSSWYIYT